MSDFEEWFLSNGIPLDTDFNVAKRAFEAGQQSQQAKIDELQARIDKALHAADESCGVSVAAFVKLNNILKAVEK